MEMNSGTYCVYVHTNKVNGKKYVGQTIYGESPQRRWDNGNGYKGCTYFYNAIQKYGWGNFKHEIVVNNLTKEEADNFEKILIEKLDTRNHDRGYNLESGGSKNKELSDETRKKLSESKKGKPTGPMSDETKRKISLANKGKVLSVETREKISAARQKCWQDEQYRDNQIESHKWQTGENHPFWGKQHSEETKEKIRQARLGTKLSEEAKARLSEAHKGENNPFYGKVHTEETKRKISETRQKIAVICVETGEFFESIALAAKSVHQATSNVSICLKYPHRTCGGFHWRCATEEGIMDAKGNVA